jgi:tRNA(Leu) C34 or U34 (ribose-2'-O)-methylase TrmL
MKGYKKVYFENLSKPVSWFPKYFVPVCIELNPSAERLEEFVHPEYAIYVFGPEDGSVYKGYRHLCHRFVQISTRHCLNLAQAVNVVLFHRSLTRWQQGLEPLPELEEQRGFIN